MPDRPAEPVRKFYRMTVTVELLMGEPPPECLDLEVMLYNMTAGHWSGVADHTSEEVSPKQMVELLIAQGSDPECLELDAEGNDLWETWGQEDAEFEPADEGGANV